jgi:uncharacterized protein YukE
VTISIGIPEAWDAFRTEANSKSDTRHEQCWDVVGEPLNTPVRNVVAGYYEKLELGDRNIAKSKRGEILDLYWGRIEQDGAALVGLGKALENLSETIDANVEAVAAQWSGESYDAFKAAMDKVRTTLDAYSAGAQQVGNVLLEAMTQARSMYQDYATASQEALTFDWISPPEQWHKMDDRTGQHLETVCPCWVDGSHSSEMLPECAKNHEQVAPLLEDQFATSRQLEACEADPCEFDVERVRLMYGNLVRHGKEGRESIRTRVREWCDATDDFKEQIKAVLDVAVGNVYSLAQSQAFSSLRIVGGVTGGEPVDDQGEVSTGGYPSGGPSAEPIVDPTTAVTPEPEPAPEPEPTPEPTPEQPAPETAVAEPAPEEAPAGTVTITDGDHTIGVRDAGEGHVTVTVTDGSGATLTYDLDFDAASGLPRTAEAEVADGVEQVPARTNGKCVIENGDTTITAERPLFAPDQITLTVDNGTGAPTTYTIDFPDDEPTGSQPATDPAESGGAAATSTADVEAKSSNGTAVPGQAGHGTSPQYWLEDARGSVSGVLIPDRDGEAELASASDKPEHDATGMVGAGLPFAGSPGPNSGEPGRAGSGWSVHGDLFDSGEPVYSMHGVLGDDDVDLAGGRS